MQPPLARNRQAPLRRRPAPHADLRSRIVRDGATASGRTSIAEGATAYSRGGTAARHGGVAHGMHVRRCATFGRASVSGSDDGSCALIDRRAVVAGLLLLLPVAPLVVACGRRGDLELPASEAADDAEDERRARDALGG